MPLSLWQVQIGSLVTGDGTNYPLDAESNGIEGLGVPTPKSADVDLAHQNGAYGSDDFMSPRVITIPYALGGTPAQVFEWLNDLNTAYAPSTTDVTLTIGLPYYADLVFTGRPRGLDANTRNSHFGIILCQATFVALDPVGT